MKKFRMSFLFYRLFITLIIFMSVYKIDKNITRLNNQLKSEIHIDYNNHKESIKLVKKYLLDFKKDMIKYNKYDIKIEDVVFQFYEDNNKESKINEYYGFGYFEENVVLLNYILWNKLSDVEKKYLIYHELGHTIYDYAHSNEGIMSYEDNFSNEEELIKDFFNGNHETNIEKYTYFNNKYLQEFFSRFLDETRNDLALGYEFSFKTIIKNISQLRNTVVGSFFIFILILIGLIKINEIYNDNY